MYVNHNKLTQWTVETVAEKLATSDAWVEQAIVALYKRQVAEETGHVGVTIYLNDRGFQQADAKAFTEYARQILRGENLNSTQIAFARRPWRRSRVPKPTICKYARQVLDLIEAKARATQAPR